MRLAILTAIAVLFGVLGASAVELRVEGRNVDVPICGGFVGIPCKANQWCNFPVMTMCGVGDQFGMCRPKPENCFELSLPVCACDGKTYANACKAHMAGFDVFYPGPCR